MGFRLGMGVKKRELGCGGQWRILCRSRHVPIVHVCMYKHVNAGADTRAHGDTDTLECVRMP